MTSARVGIAAGATDPLTRSLVRSVEAATRELGHEPIVVGDLESEGRVSTLIALGLPQYYERLLASPPAARRIAWFGEPLPRPDRGRAGSAFGRVRARTLRSLRGPTRRLRGLPLPASLDRARAAAYVQHERAANLAAALRCAATVDLVVTTSRDRAAILAGHGVRTRVVPFGYHPAVAGPLVDLDGTNATRDLPAVAFGSGMDWRSRRARGLAACASRLGRDRLRIVPTAWDADRDALLARARVLLDVHRVPGNFIGLRILLAAAAGAVLVTEPMDDPHPFEPGRHFVQASIAGLPGAVEDLLDDEPRRAGIVAATRELIRGPLTMRASLERVLA